MKTSELIGPTLDWAVAKCEANPHEVFVIKGCIDPIHSYVGGSRNDSDSFVSGYSPSTNWAQGGPIIEREKIGVSPDIHDTWRAWRAWRPFACNHAMYSYGPTPLIAVIRCYVASKLGDDVELPEELHPTMTK